MKVAYIATGAAGMVCGSCFHDNTLAAALQKLGHEVALIPTYTPIRTEEENVSIDRIFFGGLNVYLQEKIALFRHTPWFIDNLLNGRPLLNWLSKFSSSTSARDLGTLTISMLQGEEGNQSKELEKLIKWLEDEYRPDLVHLNHSLLLGFAREIKHRLRVPVVCGAQGEDLFLDGLIEPYKSQARELLRERVKDVNIVIATGDYYADFMADYLDVGRDKVLPVNLGIKLAGYGEGIPRATTGAVVIGYLARVCPEKGLHLLVEAFYKLWQKLGPDRVQLRVAGYLGKKDETYFQKLRNKIAAWGMTDAFEYVGEIDRLGKIVFLNSIDIFSVPTVYREPKGLSILEALANGVPVVQPRHGIFPEVIEKTRGGVLFEPESIDSLVEALELLTGDEGLRKKLGGTGKERIHANFGDRNMAEATLKVYRECLRSSGMQKDAEPKRVDSGQPSVNY